MNLSREAVETAVYGAVSDLNESLPGDQRVALSGTTDIFAAVDSLAALNLLLRIEERVAEASGAPCDLTEGDLYETTLFASPTLDQLVNAVHASLVGAAP